MFISTQLLVENAFVALEKILHYYNAAVVPRCSQWFTFSHSARSAGVASKSYLLLPDFCRYYFRLAFSKRSCGCLQSLAVFQYFSVSVIVIGD